jgi:hypothetical protein
MLVCIGAALDHVRDSLDRNAAYAVAAYLA